MRTLTVGLSSLGLFSWRQEDDWNGSQWDAAPSFSLGCVSYILSLGWMEIRWFTWLLRDWKVGDSIPPIANSFLMRTCRSYELVCAERFSSVVHDSQLIRISLFKNEKTLKAQSIWAILGNLDQYLVAKMRCSKIDPTGWKLTKLQKKQKNLPKLGFCRLSVM